MSQTLDQVVMSLSPVCNCVPGKKTTIPVDEQFPIRFLKFMHHALLSRRINLCVQLCVNI